MKRSNSTAEMEAVATRSGVVQQWAQYDSALRGWLGPSGPYAGIQTLDAGILLNGSTAADINKAVNDFASDIPNWASFYSSSGKQVIDAYKSIMDQTNPTNTNDAQIQKLVTAKFKQYSTAEKAFMKWLNTYKAEYDATTKQPTVPGLKKYVKANYPVDWQVNYGAYQTAANNYLQVMHANGSSAYLTALARLNTEYQKNEIPAVTTVPDAGSLLVGWKHKPTNGTSISFNHSTSDYDYSNTKWKTQSSKSIFFGFARSSSSGSSNTTSIISDSADYTIGIDFEATAHLIITSEGQWFDEAILQQYKAGPWVDGSSIQLNKEEPYGKGGVFPLMVNEFWVVMNPTIHVTIDTVNFKSFQKIVNSSWSKGIHVGPFYASGSSGSSYSKSVSTSSDKKHMTMTITDKSNIPQIIATSSEVMPG